MKKTNMKKGFTLLEILFSLAVISIVVGLGINQMSGATDAANKTVAKADLRAAIMAEHMTFADNGEYDDLVGNTNVDGVKGTLVAIPDATNPAASFCVQITWGTGADDIVSYDSADSVGIVDGACS